MFSVNRATLFGCGLALAALLLCASGVEAWERKLEGASTSPGSSTNTIETPTAIVPTPGAIESAPGGGEMMRLDDSFVHHSTELVGEGNHPVVQCR